MFRLSTLILVWIVCQGAVVKEKVWRKADNGNGHRYVVVMERDGVNWITANAIATELGGYLATITTADEHDFVFDLIDHESFWNEVNGRFYGPWIGSYTIDTKGWKWVSNEPFAYEGWLPGEPSFSSNRESKIHFFNRRPKTSRYWNDQEESNLRPVTFVVEFD